MFSFIHFSIKTTLCIAFGLMLSCFSLSAKAIDVKKYHIRHPKWTEILIARDAKFCRSNGDCGVVEVISEDEIVIKWEKYEPEEFKRNKFENTYSLKTKGSELQKEYEQFVWSLEEPYIKVNPYGRTPLSALVKFPTEEKTKISIRIKGRDGAPDIVHEFGGYKKEHEIPLVGLYPNYDNQVVIRATDEKGKSKKTQITVTVGDSNLMVHYIPSVKKDKRFHYYASTNGQIWDEKGYVRYIIMADGWHLTRFYKNDVYMEFTKGIGKYDFLGRELAYYPYPKGFFGYMHGMNFKDNGNLLVFGTYEDSKAIFDGREEVSHRDFVLEIDAKTKAIVAQYDLAEMLNPDRSLIVKSADKDFGKVDWAHTNGIDYDAKNKAVIVSGRHFGIVKIDEKTKKPLWWMTPHQLTHKSGRKGDKGDVSHLLLTAVDQNGKPYSKVVQQGIEKADGFKWPLKTHSVRYAGGGVYSIFDNSGDMYDKKLYTTKNSVASVFKIDDKKKTVQQLFLKELPEYSDMGSIVYVHPKTKEVWVFSSREPSKHTSKMHNGIMRRFSDKGELVYEAVLSRRDDGWDYSFQPFEFYSYE